MSPPPLPYTIQYLFEGDMAFVDILSVKEDEQLFDLEHPKSDEVYSGLAMIHNELSNIIADYRTAAWSVPPADIAKKVSIPEKAPQMEWGDMVRSGPKRT